MGQRGAQCTEIRGDRIREAMWPTGNSSVRVKQNVSFKSISLFMLHFKMMKLEGKRIRNHRVMIFVWLGTLFSLIDKL